MVDFFVSLHDPSQNSLFPSILFSLFSSPYIRVYSFYFISYRHDILDILAKGKKAWLVFLESTTQMNEDTSQDNRVE